MSEKTVILDGRFKGGNKYSGLARYVIEIANAFYKKDNSKFNLLLLKNTGVDIPVNIPQTTTKSTMLTLNQHLEFNLKNPLSSIDLYHYPHFDAPLCKIDRLVITIHDIYPIILKNYTNLFNRTYFKYITEINIKRANLIVSVSDFTKKTILKHFNVNPDKIIVIPNGVNEEYEKVDEREAFDRLLKYDIKFPYLLYVGNAKPHKNIKRLIKAYSKLPKNILDEYYLVLAGKREEYEYWNCIELVNTIGISDRVIFPGVIDEEDMPSLYSSAHLFCFLSLCEGFGLPPLEAMRCKTPVLASNAGAIEEVCGDTYIKTDPFDINRIADDMESAITDNYQREVLIDSGYRRSLNYTWENTADMLEELYIKVMED